MAKAAISNMDMLSKVKDMMKHGERVKSVKMKDGKKKLKVKFEDKKKELAKKCK